ncbi:MAG: glycosyltransferase family 1 protein [Candidatus Roizmanbacteria bacterium]|nr:glycosyltransferase family 1 protein [Candidatus Roizmanbacteria bacterium]
MNIGIDGNEANVDNHVGVSVYTLELLKHFAKLKRDDVRFTVFLRDEPRFCMPKEHDSFTYEVIPAKVLWSQIFLPYHLLFRSDIDIFFAPAHYSPRFLKQPLVVTIHDLSFLKFPNEFRRRDLYKLTNWTKYSIQKARHIIAVSKTTKKDILQEYPISSEKIQVIYNGFTKYPETKNSKSVIKREFGLSTNRYILHVGTLQPRKNIPTLIAAFKKFHELHPDFKLVLQGKKGWMFHEIFATVKALHMEESVCIPGYVSDEIESSLYQNAFCLAFPSLYEGFGLPILEAMSHSCPVIASHNASLPEIGGDACLYFDPKDSNDLNDKLEKLYGDKNLATMLIANGKKRIQDFSWSKCAEETLEVIESVYRD